MNIYVSFTLYISFVRGHQGDQLSKSNKRLFETEFSQQLLLQPVIIDFVD